MSWLQNSEISRWRLRGRYLATALALHLLFVAGLSWHGLTYRHPLLAEPRPVMLEVEFITAAPRVDRSERPDADPLDQPAVDDEPSPVQEVPSLAQDRAVASPSSQPASTAGDGVAAEIAGSARAASDDDGQDLQPTVASVPDAAEVGRAPVAQAGNVPDSELQAWEREIVRHLDGNKRYPASAQFRGQEDIVVLQIRVDRLGDVLWRRVVASQGYALLDREALALVDRSSPLPSPPAQVSEAELEFRVPVEFRIRQRVVRDW